MDKPKCFESCCHSCTPGEKNIGETCKGDTDKSGNCDPMCQFCMLLCPECDRERWLAFLAEFGPKR